ncbi:MAG: IS1380 family transposase [Nanoarchaeota archaeon]
MQRKSTTIFGQKKVIFRETLKKVTPFGGLSVFFEFLGKIGFAEKITKEMPFKLHSPNGITPEHTFTAFIVSVLAGARRFSQTMILRADVALHAMLGIKRFPSDDTIRNFFLRFNMGQVQRFFNPLFEWLMERLPNVAEGYTLDMDSTIFERYGKQEGALKGYNPKKRGRPSHHPLLAVLAEAHFVLHGWLRSGNCASARGAVEFLKEAMGLLNGRHPIRCVRADSGFFDQELFTYLESLSISYIVVAKMTRNVRRVASSILEWKALDDIYAAGALPSSLWGWDKERRFVVIREKIKESKSSTGRWLFDMPGYTFRVFVTNRTDAPEEIWRDYNLRGDCEKRIEELKYDLAADDFCMRSFFATEAAFRSVLILFNLLSEYQRASGIRGYRQPATLRTTVFLCGAILGRVGHNVVLHLSKAWGGLQMRNPLFDNILSYVFPTSPKLTIEEIT